MTIRRFHDRLPINLTWHDFRFRNDEKCPSVTMKVTKSCSIGRYKSNNSLLSTNDSWSVSFNEQPQPGCNNVEHTPKRCGVHTPKDVFEKEGSRKGMACCYDQKHNLLFIGGGFDVKKKTFCNKAKGSDVAII